MNTYSKQLEVRAHREPFLMNRVEVMIYERTQRDGVATIAVAQPIVFKTLAGDDLHIRQDATISLPPETAQNLIDELWRAGLRPTEGNGSAGQLGAITRHLEDMRTLVFKSNNPAQTPEGQRPGGCL